MIPLGTAKSPDGTSEQWRIWLSHVMLLRGRKSLMELIDELTRSLGDRGTQCVVCKVQSNELTVAHALEQCGFLLMDTLQDFVFDFSRAPIEEINPPQRDEQLAIRRANPADLEHLWL